MLCDPGGGLSRPDTFCRNRRWDDPEGARSSIDAIVVNSYAHRYVRAVEVEQTAGLQHAIVSATFEFPQTSLSANQRPFKWVPHAALDLSSMGKPDHREHVAQQLWMNKFEAKCQCAQDSESLLSLANEFAVEILISSGAKWKHGSKVRNKIPQFHGISKQRPEGTENDQSSRTLNAFSKNLCRIDDIATKIAIQEPNAHTKGIVDRAWAKFVDFLKVLEYPFIPDFPCQVHLNEIWVFISNKREKLVRALRTQRVRTWRDKMKASSMRDCKDVYSYLKRKHEIPRHAGVTNQNNMPIFNPQDALDLVPSQWNRIFESNSNPIPTEHVMNSVGNYLFKNKLDFDLPHLTCEDLYLAVQARKSDASAGIDGWRTREFQALRRSAFFPWVMLWDKIERDVFQLPQLLKVARLAMIPKPEAKSMQPIDQRLITLLSIPYLAWSRARFSHSTVWQSKVFPSNLCGGIQKRKASDVAHHIGIDSEFAVATKPPLVGIKLDRSKCFDRVDVGVVCAFASALCLDKRFLAAWKQVYQGFARHVTIGQYIDPVPLSCCNGVAQGDCASVLAVNILMTGWARIMENFHGVKAFCFIDDAYLYGSIQSFENLQLAIAATRLFDKLVGQKLSLEKSSGWATSPEGKKPFEWALPRTPHLARPRV